MNDEAMSAAEALGLQEYVPYARKHPDSQKGFVCGMRRKNKRDDLDEIETYLHTGSVRAAVAALIADRDALDSRCIDLLEAARWARVALHDYPCEARDKLDAVIASEESAGGAA